MTTPISYTVILAAPEDYACNETEPTRPDLRTFVIDTDRGDEEERVEYAIRGAIHEWCKDDSDLAEWLIQAAGEDNNDSTKDALHWAILDQQGAFFVAAVIQGTHVNLA